MAAVLIVTVLIYINVFVSADRYRGSYPKSSHRSEATPAAQRPYENLGDPGQDETASA